LTLGLHRQRHCVLTTGCGTLNDGLDIVVEGDATLVSDEAQLVRVADAYESTVFGFGKGEFSQTRWRFERG
jgi:hypothetical protein